MLAGALVLPNIALAGDELSGMATKLQGVFVTIGGAVVTIGWIVAGILYLTSAGSPERMKTAKTAIVAAIIGTILVIIAGTTNEATNFIKQYWTK